MPSTSKKQRNFMAAAAHNPAFAKKVGIPQSVAQEFNQADKGKKFGSGGMAKMKHDDLAEDKKLIKKAFGMHDKQEHPGKKTDLSKLKKGGMTMKKMCSGGKAKRYDDGGEVEFETKIGPNKNITDDIRERAMKAVAEGGQKEPAAPKAKPKMKAKAKSNAMTDSMSRMNPMGDTYKKGGSVGSASRRADGIAVRGKTKGRMV